GPCACGHAACDHGPPRTRPQPGLAGRAPASGRGPYSAAAPSGAAPSADAPSGAAPSRAAPSGPAPAAHAPSRAASSAGPRARAPPLPPSPSSRTARVTTPRRRATEIPPARSSLGTGPVRSTIVDGTSPEQGPPSRYTATASPSCASASAAVVAGGAPERL